MTGSTIATATTDTNGAIGTTTGIIRSIRVTATTEDTNRIDMIAPTATARITMADPLLESTILMTAVAVHALERPIATTLPKATGNAVIARVGGTMEKMMATRIL